MSHTDLHEEASRLPFVEGSVSSKNGGLPLPLNEPLHCPGMPWPKPETEISTAGEGKAVWLEDHATTNCQLGPFCRLRVWPDPNSVADILRLRLHVDASHPQELGCPPI